MGIHNHHRRGHGAHHRVKRDHEVFTVFVTPEVTGSVIGFKTLGEPVAFTPSPTPSSNPDEFQQDPQQDPNSFSFDEQPTRRPSRTHSAKAKSTSLAIDTKLYSPSPTSEYSSASSTVIGALESASSTSSAVPNGAVKSGGLSPSAVAGLAGAGIAIAIILGIVAFIFYRRRSQQKRQEAYENVEEENEKTGLSDAGAASGAATPPVVVVSEFNEKPELSPSPVTSERAPRVSLRPVTQFMPNLSSGDQNAGVATGGAASGATLGVIGAPGTSTQQQQQQQQQQQTTQLARTLSRKEPPPALVLIGSNDAPQGQETPGSGPLPPPGPIVSSPTPSAFTDSSVAVSPFVGASISADAASTPPVHRVQMDFTPSMGDELELRAGQLVRVLHEYDDGWALCIRLDRSQQGVCPRTCLSQRPVKPRPPQSALGNRGSPPRPGVSGVRSQSPHVFPSPGGRPNGDASRSGSPAPRFPMGPGSHAGGRQSPRPQSPVSRPQSPVVRSQSPVMRPYSPAGRPQSPGAGYVKAQYRPVTPSESRPQSQVASGNPTTPTITVSPSLENGRPASPSHQALPRPQSPTVAPRPAVAPIRPSPLSNQTSSSDDEDKKAEQQQPQLSSSPPVFHAM